MPIFLLKKANAYSAITSRISSKSVERFYQTSLPLESNTSDVPNYLAMLKCPRLERNMIHGRIVFLSRLWYSADSGEVDYDDSCTQFRQQIHICILKLCLIVRTNNINLLARALAREAWIYNPPALARRILSLQTSALVSVLLAVLCVSRTMHHHYNRVKHPMNIAALFRLCKAE
jgi:hypothetical protein